MKNKKFLEEIFYLEKPYFSFLSATKLISNDLAKDFIKELKKSPSKKKDIEAINEDKTKDLEKSPSKNEVAVIESESK